MYFSSKTKNYLDQLREDHIMKTYMENLRDEVRDEYYAKTALTAKKILDEGFSEDRIINILELSQNFFNKVKEDYLKEKES
jgi:hypothetical protein